LKDKQKPNTIKAVMYTDEKLAKKTLPEIRAIFDKEYKKKQVNIFEVITK